MRHLPISILPMMDYCEYQIYLQYVRGIRAKPTAAMLQGIQRHKQLEDEFLETAEEIGEPIEEHIMKLLRGEVSPFSLREFYVQSDRMGLHGYIDEISLYRETAIVIDDKPRFSVTDGYKRQVAAYAASFREKYGWEENLFLALRNRDTGEVYWTDQFTRLNEADLDKTVERLHCLLAGDLEFRPASEPGKCSKCRFAFACPAAPGRPNM